MLPKSYVGICAGVAGAIFIGYCIYFDQKRRSDPQFRKKLRERRKAAGKRMGGKSDSSVVWPNLKDSDAVQKFFLNEVKLGEDLLSVGEVESGVDHLSRAVAVCGQPQQLLQVLQTSLPPTIFQLLLLKLPAIGESIMSSSANSTDKASVVVEDDVE